MDKKPNALKIHGEERKIFMKKRTVALFLSAMMSLGIMTGCGGTMVSDGGSAADNSCDSRPVHHGRCPAGYPGLAGCPDGAAGSVCPVAEGTGAHLAAVSDNRTAADPTAGGRFCPDGGRSPDAGRQLGCL